MLNLDNDYYFDSLIVDSNTIFINNIMPKADIKTTIETETKVQNTSKKEILIGAEIIKTIVVRTVEEFLLLFFAIVSRGLFSLILYFERRWHGSEQKSAELAASEKK